MKFDSIFPIIIVIIYIASLYFSAKKKKKQAEEKAKAKGEKPGKKLPAWRQALDNVTSRIQREFEPPGEGPSREGDVWKMLTGQTPAPGHERTPSAPDLVEEPIEPPPGPMQAFLDVEPETIEPSLEKIPRRATVSDLRNAVVWAEILGPPVALRKD